MRSITRPGTWGTPVLIVVCLLLIVLVGIADYVTGPELAFSIFYLLPVTLAAWHGGRRLGLVISLVSAVAWFVADFLGTPAYAHPLVPYWNGAVYFGFYVIVTMAMSALHAARRMQAQLTGLIVHDLRAPLVTLQMAIEEVRRLGAQASPDQQGHLLDIAEASSRRMMPLINSLLDLPRLRRGRMPVSPREATVSETVEAAVDQVALWARNYEVELRRDLAPEPATLCLDRDLTVRVLVNLLSNAIKQSPPQSTVTVGSRPEGPDRVAFTVADEGPGVPEEWLSRVFDQYAQVEGRQQGAIPGTGLGLTFCRLAVEAQGGRIWIVNRPDRGALVTFTLPVSVTPRGERAPGACPEAPH